MFSRPGHIFAKFLNLPPNLPAAFLGLQSDRRNNINTVVWEFLRIFSLPQFRVQNSVHRWTPFKAD